MTICKTKQCIHRRGCLKWVGNYNLEFVGLEFIDEKECRDSEPYLFKFLDRFRNSDGSKTKKDGVR